MPSFLTFSLDSKLDPESLRIVETNLRRQLTGLRLQPSAVGQAFEVRGEAIPNQRVGVRIERLPPGGVSVDARTEFAFVGYGQPPFPVGDVTLRRTGNAIPEVSEGLRHYTSAMWIDSFQDEYEFERSAARIDDLVGVPHKDVVEDVTARLRGAEWLADWSHRHYGQLISGAADVIRSTPFLVLAGDPGTGKSVLVHQLPAIVARRLTSSVLFIQLNDKLRGTGIQGKAGTGVVSVIEEIGWLAERLRLPTVVFLDEAEAVAGSRRLVDGSSGSAENLAVTDALIVGLDQVFARTDLRLIFIMATNLVSQIDSAVLRRATVYTFDRPSRAHRRLILQRTLGEVIESNLLDSLNDVLERPDLPLTAADVLSQVVSRAIREAAQLDHPIDVARLRHLAARATATASVSTTSA